VTGTRNLPLAAGTLLLVAAAAWQAGRLADGHPVQPDLLLHGLWLATALAVALLAPLAAHGRPAGEALLAALLPVLVPLPLVALGILAGGATLLTALTLTLGLALAALLLAGLGRLLSRRPAVVQCAAVALAWATRGEWLAGVAG